MDLRAIWCGDGTECKFFSAMFRRSFCYWCSHCFALGKIILRTMKNNSVQLAEKEYYSCPLLKNYIFFTMQSINLMHKQCQLANATKFLSCDRQSKKKSDINTGCTSMMCSLLLILQTFCLVPFEADTRANTRPARPYRR